MRGRREGETELAQRLEDSLGDVEKEVAEVYLAIAKTASKVSRELPFHVGMASGLNPSGERQAKLDIHTNDVFADALLRTGVVGEVASEEMERPKESQARKRGMLSVAMDPLDGSSNIPTNNPLGSIFGIWRGKLPQAGRELVGSAFVTYGPTLTLTLVAGDRVDLFVELRDGSHSGGFVLAEKGLELPDKMEVYGFGGERRNWTPPVARFVKGLEERGLKLRYGGTFIGDLNQVLKRGGIFAYPELREKPNGKLRLLYETAPVSYLIERAGGSSTDGHRSILDILPSEFPETSPFYVGNTELIRALEKALATPA